jgi:hypothetical protein
MTKPQDISKALFGMAQDEYGDNYREHLLVLYRIYLESAEKISDRRSNANTFFLTINTALISALGISGIISQKTSSLLFIMVGLTALLLCYSWYRLIRSYKDLNTAKFRVIHEIEKHLPLRPYNAEWDSVGRGENKQLYLPFTHIEIYVPWIFTTLYTILILYGIYLFVVPLCI